MDRRNKILFCSSFALFCSIGDLLVVDLLCFLVCKKLVKCPVLVRCHCMLSFLGLMIWLDPFGLYGGMMDFDGIRISSVDDCLPTDGKYDSLYKYASKL